MRESRWCSKHNQYAHSCTECATSILPGDLLIVSVPCKLSDLLPWDRILLKMKHFLQAGQHELAVVSSLAAKPDMLRFKMRLFGVSSRMSKEPFNVSIPGKPIGAPCLFLGRDKWPVEFTHKPNLTARMKQSIKETKK